MADNTTLNAGVGGDTYASDDIGGVKHQRVKVEWGTDGTVNEADTATGKPLPVQLRSSTGEDSIKHEDDASASAHPGLAVLAVRKATPANTSDTDGDYEMFQMSAGRLWASVINEASETFLGFVGGKTVVLSSSITMSAAGSYATGDYIGTTTSPQSFANAVRVSAGTGIIKSLTISDKIVTANVAMELWLFSATFTAPTDNAAWAISDAEALTVLGVIPILTSNWYASSNNQIYFDGNLSIPIKPAATSLFYALVSRGTTPSFTSADLQLTLGILQD